MMRTVSTKRKRARTVKLRNIYTSEAGYRMTDIFIPLLYALAAFALLALLVFLSFHINALEILPRCP